MRWRSGRRSSNVEDRRGQRPGGKGIKLGGGAMIAVIVIGLLMGVDPM
ncbi:MAG: neutral zinc metallopeptidase, partial [Pseudomonadota bacterium]|nr:neutral zinc metallopeptidase [Pseudomonadota bacterium]